MTRTVAILHGGLGNQLFQYAAALSIDGIHDPRCVSLVSYGNEWGADHPDISSIAGMPINYPNRRMRSTLPGVAVRETWRDDLSRSLAAGWSRVARIELIRQADPFAPRVSTNVKTRALVLDGFFQNRDWWLPTWRIIANQINERRPDGVDDLRQKGRTAIKLRRSDYLGRGIVVSDNYYRSALERLGVRNQEVLVICEDSEYLTHFAGLLAEYDCVLKTPEAITGNPNFDDFWHLASARTQVLANSSYCWWAAAVACVSTEGTEVAYPSPWLPNTWSKGPMPDMGIPGWIAVTAEFE